MMKTTTKKKGHECERGQPEGVSGRRREGPGKGLFKDSTVKPTEHCFRRGEEVRNENIMEEVNLFKVHCTHVWSYRNEAPSYNTH
jgi:hypothetical protein